MSGACPPNSIDTCWTESALCLINCLPTGVEPVNVIFLICGVFVKISPIVPPDPFTYCTASSGMPASCANSINFIVVSGVSLAGFTINVQPAARAGAAFLVIIAAGKFQGVMAATTPTG